MPQFKTIFRLCFLGIILCGLWSCKGSAGAGTPPTTDAGLQAADVIGRWCADDIDVNLVSVGGTGKDSAYVIQAKAMAAKTGMQPAFTVLEANGKYREETYTLGDSLVRQQAGYWHIFQDSLYLRQDGVGSVPTAFHAQRKGPMLLLRFKGDFDGDGARDDRWQLNLRRK